MAHSVFSNKEWQAISPRVAWQSQFLEGPISDITGVGLPDSPWENSEREIDIEVVFDPVEFLSDLDPEGPEGDIYEIGLPDVP